MKHFLLIAAVGVCSGGAFGQTIDPYYNCAYTYSSLGLVPGVPANFGGLVFKHDDPNTLLIGGAANQAGANIYAVQVVRDAENQITGWGGTATVFASAPNIDGGLCYGPDDVLFFSRYSMNALGQIKPGSVAPDRNIDLTPLGFTSSVGALMVVPQGFPGAGRLKVLPYNSGRWHDAVLTPDGNGTFDVSAPLTDYFLGGGPEGIVYVEAGASLFPFASVLISEYSSGLVVSYEVDSNGDPIAATRRVFISGLSGAEGGTRDPLTGDFLFSTFGGASGVIVVRGFTPDCDVPANINRDCALDFFDVQLFLSSFAAGDLLADFVPDGVLNFFDVQAFLTSFSGGCN
ncbi:MAG: hypothetical protein KF757_02475 [Phycisphaeraceae bacterium]|nr:hypothetical protein [Phycisphaeraceae bacterium]MCW5762077.1 hypothetical protein [Phycisphaeraceae bacterium]